MVRETNGFQYIRVQSIPSFGFRLYITNLQKNYHLFRAGSKKNMHKDLKRLVRTVYHRHKDPKCTY